MSELSLASILGILCIVALALIAYLTLNIRTLENDLQDVKRQVNEHTGMSAHHGQRLGRVENLIITNSGKLNVLIERNKQCHQLHLESPGDP